MKSLFTENAEMSKTAKKNKKRAEKREKTRLQNKLAEDVENIVELKDPISVLRDELQEAKLNKVVDKLRTFAHRVNVWYL